MENSTVVCVVDEYMSEGVDGDNEVKAGRLSSRVTAPHELAQLRVPGRLAARPNPKSR